MRISEGRTDIGHVCNDEASDAGSAGLIIALVKEAISCEDVGEGVGGPSSE